MLEDRQVALALSGGATRGAYHLGVLAYLDEAGIKVKAISATSIGSVIATSYACGISPKEQLEIFKSREFKRIFSFKFPKTSFIKIDKHAKVLDKLIKKETLEEIDIKIVISAINLKTGEYIYFSKGDIRSICFASCALVPFFEKVEYNGYDLIDGGYLNNMPIDPLLELDLPIVGVNLLPAKEFKKKPNILNITKRLFFLHAHHQSNKNENMCSYVITSPELSKYSIFSFKHLDKLFAMGYEDAKEVLSQY